MAVPRTLHRPYDNSVYVTRRPMSHFLAWLPLVESSSGDGLPSCVEVSIATQPHSGTLLSLQGA